MNLQELFLLENEDLETCVLDALQSIQKQAGEDLADLTRSGDQMSPATALLSLFFELAKTDCDKERFFIHCRSYTNNDEKIGLLWQAFAANKRLLRNILACHANRTTLSSMDWRLEFDVATKSLEQLSSPKFLLKMNFLEGAGNAERNNSRTFSADIQNLRHMLDSLECALKTGKTTYLKKKNILS